MTKDLYRIYFDPEAETFVLDETRMYALDEIDAFHSRPDQHIANDHDDIFFQEKKFALQAIQNLNRSIEKGELKHCKECGRRFWLTEDEEGWFACRNLFPPKRCPECRKARKQKEQ